MKLIAALLFAFCASALGQTNNYNIADKALAPTTYGVAGQCWTSGGAGVAPGWAACGESPAPSGTVALGTSAISSAACAAVAAAVATGALTTDVVGWGFNGDPTAVTGYVPSTSGMLTIIAYPTSNTVNFKVCNNTADSITPGAVTLNWKVIR